MNKEIVYKIGGLKRPSVTKKQRLLLKLNKIPFVRNLQFIRSVFCRNFNLPLSVSYNKRFFSSATNLNVGEKVGLADTFILAYAPVTIGEGTSFSFDNKIITSSHDFNDFSTIIAKPVAIGVNCWITTNVIILPGVTIGDHTVIAPGSVVTKDIPSGVLAGGNPCKVIKEINLVK